MADISAEIAAFKNAVYGEDVRDAMVSLANKLNNVITTGITQADAYNREKVTFYIGNEGRFFIKNKITSNSAIGLAWGNEAVINTTNELVIKDGVNNIAKSYTMDSLPESIPLVEYHGTNYIAINYKKALVYDTTDKTLAIINISGQTIDSRYHIIVANWYNQFVAYTNPRIYADLDYRYYTYISNGGYVIVNPVYDENDVIIGNAFRLAQNNLRSSAQFRITRLSALHRLATDFNPSSQLASLLETITYAGYTYYIIPIDKALVLDTANNTLVLSNVADKAVRDEVLLFHDCYEGGSVGRAEREYEGELVKNIYKPTNDDINCYVGYSGSIDLCRSIGSTGEAIGIRTYSGNRNYADTVDNTITITNKLLSINTTFFLNDIMSSYTLDEQTWYYVENNRELVYNVVTNTCKLKPITIKKDINDIVLLSTASNSIPNGLLLSLFTERHLLSNLYNDHSFYIGNQGYLDILSGAELPFTTNGKTYIRASQNNGSEASIIVMNRRAGTEISYKLSESTLNTISYNDRTYYVIPANQVLIADLVSKNLLLLPRTAALYGYRSQTSWVIIYGGAYDTSQTSPMVIAHNKTMKPTYEEARQGARITRDKIEEFVEHMVGSTDDESFIFVTDVHSHFNELVFENAHSTGYDLVKAYSRNAPVDFVLNGGDWLNNSATIPQAKAYLGFISSINKEMFKKSYLVVGNHDYNYQGVGPSGDPNSGQMSIEELHQTFLRDQPNTYYDFYGKHTHFYVFDSQIDWTSDSLNTYTTQQVVWFAENLLTDTNAHIAIAIHIWWVSWTQESIETDPQHNDPSSWYRAALSNTLVDIIDAFNDRSTYTFNGVTYDYSTKTNRIEFVICGHTHKNLWQALSSGVPVINTTNFCNTYVREFDLVYADYDVRKIYTTRVGFQGSREWSLDTGQLIVESE